jgi:hypothetical protein
MLKMRSRVLSSPAASRLFRDISAIVPREFPRQATIIAPYQARLVRFGEVFTMMMTTECHAPMKIGRLVMHGTCGIIFAFGLSS